MSEQTSEKSNAHEIATTATLRDLLSLRDRVDHICGLLERCNPYLSIDEINAIGMTAALVEHKFHISPVAQQESKEEVRRQGIGAILAISKMELAESRAALEDAENTVETSKRVMQDEILQWKEKIRVAKAAYYLSHLAAERLTSKIKVHIEQDERYRKPSTVLTLQSNQKTLISAAFPTLADLALSSSKKILALEGIGDAAVRKVVEYFDANGLVHLITSDIEQREFRNCVIRDVVPEQQSVDAFEHFTDETKWRIPTWCAAGLSNVILLEDPNHTDPWIRARQETGEPFYLVDDRHAQRGSK